MVVVRANWFATDDAVVRQGLFVSCEWLDSGIDDGPRKTSVMVTYRDEKGFPCIEQFLWPIIAGHKEVRPAGYGLKDLRSIVEFRKLLERLPFVSKQPVRQAN